MAVIILNRGHGFQFKEWLKDVEEPLIFLTNTDRKDFRLYDHAKIFPDMDNRHEVDVYMMKLRDWYRITNILCHSEYDLIRSARFREFWDIEGQGVLSAVAYRDKVVMKRILQQDGIKVAPFKKIEHPIDVVSFIKEHGLPVVIKPVDGGGSRNVRIIRTIRDFERYCSEQRLEHMMIEKFVSGKMYHVDGIMKHKKILFSCTSQYFNNCLSYQEGKSSGSFVINQNSEISHRLKSLVKKVVLALPSSPITAFHAEVFHTKEDELILCEIASRTGGGRINDAIFHTFGFDLNRTWIRLQYGFEEKIRIKEGEYCGFLIFPPKSGKISALPERSEMPFPWIVDYKTAAKKGKVMNSPSSSVDHVATVVVRGPDERSLKKRLKMIDDWLDERVRYDTKISSTI